MTTFWKDLRSTHFNEAIDDLYELWNDDQLEECVIMTRDLLDNPCLPRYHRMRALILLGSTLEDLDDCQDCYEQAESIWRLVKYWNPERQDKDVDEVLAGLRRSLNRLGRALDDEGIAMMQREQAIEDDVDGYESEFTESEVSNDAMELEDEDTELARHARVQVEAPKTEEENHSNEARTQLHPLEALDAGVVSDYQYIDDLKADEATKAQLRRRFGGYMDIAVTVARKVLTGATTLKASEIPGMTSKSRTCIGFSAQGALAIGQGAEDVEPGQAQKDKGEVAMPKGGDSTTRPGLYSASSDSSDLSDALNLPKKERR